MSLTSKLCKLCGVDLFWKTWLQCLIIDLVHSEDRQAWLEALNAAKHVWDAGPVQLSSAVGCTATLDTAYASFIIL